MKFKELGEHINDVRTRLERKEFIGEAAVRQGIIDRLLAALKWPTYDTLVVCPEYGIDTGSVDYALCHPASTPRVLIEVKSIGNIDSGTKQLFDYAYRIGVTILVLTDGQTWRFYHPAGEGSYEDRQVVKLDIIEDSETCSKNLDRYLNYESVKTGEAAKTIATDYQRIVNQRRIEEVFPEVWKELVREKNEFLLHAVEDKVKDKVGLQPTEEQVLIFLKSLSPKGKPQKDKKEKKTSKRLRCTMPDEEVIEHTNAKDTFVEVLEKLGLSEAMRIHPKIVSTEPFSPNTNSVQRGEFHVKTHSQTLFKKRVIENIAKQLDIPLKVELVEKS